MLREKRGAAGAEIDIGVPVMVHLGGQDQICPNFRQSPLRPRSSAVGARIEAPKALRGIGCGEGVSPSPRGRGLCPSPENFSIFELK